MAKPEDAQQPSNEQDPWGHVSPDGDPSGETDPAAGERHSNSAQDDHAGAGERAPVRRLDDRLVDKIAAGEVVERPASVVKELVENAIDAGARGIEIAVHSGGTALIRVADDGHGIPAEELPLAVSRHCTSKIVDAAGLSSIRTMGFRGEALPSIGAVGRLSLVSRHEGADSAWGLSVEGGRVGAVEPAARGVGTTVEVRDLFHATPARLKFMKTERTEAAAVSDIVKRLALASPGVAFALSGGQRTTRWPAGTTIDRVRDVMGADFAAEAIPLAVERHGVRLSGFLGLPTDSRANANHVHAFVNGRLVRDRLVTQAIRAGYQDVMTRERYPQAVAFVWLDPAAVDVNVHPAKADVRFRDQNAVRGLIVSAIRKALAEAAPRTARSISSAALGHLAARSAEPSAAAEGLAEEGQHFRTAPAARRFGYSAVRRSDLPGAWRPARPGRHAGNGDTETGPALREGGINGASAAVEGSEQGVGRHGVGDGVGDAAFPGAGSGRDIDRGNGQDTGEDLRDHPLGAAVAQVHRNYVIAQTADGIVIVDQHAAHERIVFEALKVAAERETPPAQGLLIPEVVELPPEDVVRLSEHGETFARVGLTLEPFGPGAMVVRETPAALGTFDVARLVRELADEIAAWGTAEALEARLSRVAATMACHGSVRSGRALRPEEMDALLRQIETTPSAAQCNHGRPTFVTLSLAEIERLFERR